MPEDNPRRFHLNLPASDELRVQSARTGISHDLLEDQAAIFAALSTGAEEGLVEPKHVIQAAEQLSEILTEREERREQSIFLNYSTKDEDFARELEADLRSEGVSCFLAPLSIKPGTSWPDEIWNAIRGCRVFVLLVTASAMKSKWCLLEIGAALVLKKQIIAVLRHSTRLPDVLKTVQAMKVQTKKQQADLLEHLKKACSS